MLNASHFDIPQKRERVYIVCFRNDIKNGNNFKFPDGKINEISINNILEKNVDAKYFLSQQYWNTLKKHKERHSKKGNGFGYQIIKHNEMANTIMCGGMGKERNLIIDYNTPLNLDKRKTKMDVDNVRAMTPREWARLQGFSDSFKLDNIDSHAYKQLGNCVVIPVISSIAKKIIKKLQDNK